MCYCYCEAKVHSSSVSVVYVVRLRFEGSPSKEGFHRTHGTPSGSATAHSFKIYGIWPHSKQASNQANNTHAHAECSPARCEAHSGSLPHPNKNTLCFDETADGLNKVNERLGGVAVCLSKKYSMDKLSHR